MFVIGSYSLIQQLSSGSLRWFRCAYSAGSEKPEEAKRRPLWTQVQRPTNTAFWWGFFFGVISPFNLASPAGISVWWNDECVVFKFPIKFVEFSFYGFAGAAHLFPLRKSLPNRFAPGLIKSARREQLTWLWRTEKNWPGGPGPISYPPRMQRRIFSHPGRSRWIFIIKESVYGNDCGP